MPVSRRTAEGLSDELVNVYARAEVRLLRLLGAHLAAGHDSPQWMERKLAELQTFRKRATRVMEAATQEAVGAIGDAVTTAYTRGMATGEHEAASVGLRPHGVPTQAEHAVESLTRAAHGTLTELGPRVVRSVADAYRDAVVAASAGTLTGATTRVQDAQAALDTLARKGVTGFVDSRGREWGLQSYVDMATRTTTAQAAVQGHMDRLEQAGVNLFLVSTSSRECDICADWEGKVLSRGPVDALQVNVLTGQLERVDVDGTVQEATSAGLFHPNCTHNLTGYIHGATKRGDITDGSRGYAAQQQQRAMERKVREWKRREASAITPEAKRKATAKVREWQRAIKAHTDAHDLPRKPARESFDVTPPTAPTPLRAVGDVSKMDDEVLVTEMQDLMAAEDFGPRFEQITDELDRRDQAKAQVPQVLEDAPDPVAEHAALKRLLFGDPADQPKRDPRAAQKRRRREQWEAYDGMVEAYYLQAEDACRGVMLSKEGVAKGIDARWLFTRQTRSLKYASEELQRWFADNPGARTTWTEFRDGRMAGRYGWESEFG